MLQSLSTMKGSVVAVNDLLASMQDANKVGGLTIKFIDSKATLVFAHNSKGPLSGVAASVIYRMLLSKFRIKMSEAYEVAAFLSEQLGGNPIPAKTENTVTATTVPVAFKANAEMQMLKADIAEKLSVISAKSTKKEMLEAIAQLQALVK